VSTKIFAGIMLGLGFHLISRLFGHLGQLAAWPPILAAFVPTATFLALAILMPRWRVGRPRESPGKGWA
jgi:lipopolysaccharide export system permease protein